MRKIVRVVTLLLIATPGITFAESEPKWNVSLIPGEAITQGASDQILKSDFAISGAGEYQFRPGIWAGMEIGYSGHNIDGATDPEDFDGDGVPESLRITSDVKAQFFHFTPYAKYSKNVEFQGLKMRPFVQAGGGLFHLASKAGTTFISGTTSTGLTFANVATPQAASSDYYFGINTGLGVDFPLNEHWAWGFSCQYRRVFEPGGDDEFIIPSGRISYSF